MKEIKLKKWQRTFVNRSLNMAKIKAIGFDMDHTLITYKRESFEALAFQEAVKKLVELGYPGDLLQLKFQPNFIIRGLLLDVARGNLLKVDGHKYVKCALHGHRKLSKADRHAIYNNASFRAGEFVSLDTFFALSEFQLFIDLVEYHDHNPGRISKSYSDLYYDVKRAIDLSHADGSIKERIIAAPEKYIQVDKQVPKTLAHLVEGGKSLFLLTNSLWEYTSGVMDYLLKAVALDSTPWQEYFDYIIVGAGKPGFFTGSQPFYEVVTESNLLRIHSGALGHEHVYHGGNAVLFQELTGFRGDEILYVGDHIYGDIMRSKGTLNWRTMLILEELEDELPKLEEIKPKSEHIDKMLAEREHLEEQLQILRSKIASNNRQAERAIQTGDRKKQEFLVRENHKLYEKEEAKSKEIEHLEKAFRQLLGEREDAIHPIWGELMKAGLERSRFADQVVDYACIYSSRVSNLRYHSPFKKFTSFQELMPHDF